MSEISILAHHSVEGAASTSVATPIAAVHAQRISAM